MNTHHGIRLDDLYDYYLETADKTTAGRVEAHIASCMACREMLRVMALLSGASAEEVSPPNNDHPLLEELVSYYRNATSLNPTTHRRIEEHLAECGDCRSELRFLEELEKDMRGMLAARSSQSS